MALQDKLIKINLDNLDTKGIYFKDKNSTFKTKEINKSKLNKRVPSILSTCRKTL